MARKRFQPNPAVRLPAIDERALALLAPESTGCGLNGPMRLVALLLMLWEDERGRVHWDHDRISDCTGLSPAQVADALDKLRQVRLVRETAAGPELTWDEFSRLTLPAWRQAAQLRPIDLSGSPQHQPTRSHPHEDHSRQAEAQ